MHYIIDGYNLLFRRFKGVDDLKASRQRIIEELDRKTGVARLNASLVFDAPFQQGEGSRFHFHHLEILFTASGESADDFILNTLRTADSPQRKTIVTSDKQLACHARGLGAKSQTVEEFSKSLLKTYQNRIYREKTTPPLTKPSVLKIGALDSISTSKVPLREGTFEYYLEIFEQKYRLLSNVSLGGKFDDF